MTQRWRLLLLPATAVLLALLAFGLPFLAFADASTPLTHEQATRLKARARHQFDFPPLKLQVVSGDAASADPDAGRGETAVRSLFGIRTGRVTDSRTGTIDTSRSKWEAALWICFLGIEVGLVLGFIALWQTGDEDYDDEDEVEAPTLTPQPPPV